MATMVVPWLSCTGTSLAWGTGTSPSVRRRSSVKLGPGSCPEGNNGRLIAVRGYRLGCRWREGPAPSEALAGRLGVERPVELGRALVLLVEAVERLPDCVEGLRDRRAQLRRLVAELDPVVDRQGLRRALGVLQGGPGLGQPVAQVGGDLAAPADGGRAGVLQLIQHAVGHLHRLLQELNERPPAVGRRGARLDSRLHVLAPLLEVALPRLHGRAHVAAPRAGLDATRARAAAARGRDQAEHHHTHRQDPPRSQHATRLVLTHSSGRRRDYTPSRTAKRSRGGLFAAFLDIV